MTSFLIEISRFVWRPPAFTNPFSVCVESAFHMTGPQGFRCSCKESKARYYAICNHGLDLDSFGSFEFFLTISHNFLSLCCWPGFVTCYGPALIPFCVLMFCTAITQITQTRHTNVIKYFRKQLKGRKRWVIMSFSKQQEKKKSQDPELERLACMQVLITITLFYIIWLCCLLCKVLSG